MPAEPATTDGGDGPAGPLVTGPLEGQREVLRNVVLVVGLTVAVVVLVTAMGGTADGRFPINNFTNIDDAAAVTPNGQNVAVSGWVKCTEGEIAEVRVTVGQEGREATGRTHVRCLGLETVQTWTSHVTTRGTAGFDPDRPVRVDAWAVPRAHGERTDEPFTWTNDGVTLTDT